MNNETTMFCHHWSGLHRFGLADNLTLVVVISSESRKKGPRTKLRTHFLDTLENVRELLPLAAQEALQR